MLKLMPRHDRDLVADPAGGARVEAGAGDSAGGEAARALLQHSRRIRCPETALEFHGRETREKFWAFTAA